MNLKALMAGLTMVRKGRGTACPGQNCRPPATRSQAALAALLAFSATIPAAFAEEPLFSSVTELAVPAGDGAREPALFAMADGRVLMSWTEPSEAGFAVRVATGDASGWSEPRTVVQADDLFVNWADFPSAVAWPDGTLAAHWLRTNGDASYSYDVNIARSDDEGRTWGQVVVPHRDGTQRQHGFVTLLPVDGGRLMALWLDGRNYAATGGFASGDAASDAMQLRTTILDADGGLSDDTLLDARTCTCCQTSAAVTGSGKVLVVYRDRSEDEIRDISILRMADGVWSQPEPVSRDGWQIGGCPVNGPAIDSSGRRAAVAWFTAADNVPKVKLAFSDDDGESFGAAIGIDQGSPTGRVDVLQLEDGSALASWLEQTSLGEAIYLCRVTAASGCGEPKVVAISRTGRTLGFPRMVLGGDGVYIAWTAPGKDRTASPDDNVKIRMVVAKLGGGQ